MLNCQKGEHRPTRYGDKPATGKDTADCVQWEGINGLQDHPLLSYSLLPSTVTVKTFAQLMTTLTVTHLRLQSFTG